MKPEVRWPAAALIVAGYAMEMFGMANFVGRTHAAGVVDAFGRVCFFVAVPVIVLGGYWLARAKRRSILWAFIAPLWLPGLIAMAVLWRLPVVEDYEKR